MADITLWKPEKNVVQHQALGKLAEETGELQQIVARCLIQGLAASDPKSGQSNRNRLEEEIADVLAAVTWLRSVAYLGTDAPREIRKVNGYRRWQRMLEADASISSGEIRRQIISLFEQATGVEPEVLEDRSGEPMNEIGISDDHKLAVSGDIWISHRIPITIPTDLRDDASIDDVVEAVEDRVRRMAEVA